jgi:hypothetical protein
MPYDNPESLTHSKLVSYSCPARYEKLYIQGLSDTSDPARRGSCVHRANELYLKALAGAGCPSDSDMASAALQQAIVDETTPAHLVPDCEYLWSNHVESFELDLGAFLEAEKRRTIGQFSFKADYTYALPSALEVHDLKTHFHALTEDGAKRDFQARMSAFLAAQEWPGFPVYRFVFHFIRLRQTVVATFEPADLDKIGRQLAAHAEGIRKSIETGEWPAAPGQQCAYCSFACPAVDDAARLPMRLLTSVDAGQVASDLVVLKQAVAAKLRVLDAYAGINGPVAAAGFEWAHRPVETVKFPAGQVCDELHRLGVDYSKLTLGKTALKSYLTAKKWAHVAAALNPLAKVTQGTKFSAKKLGTTDDEEGDES